MKYPSFLMSTAILLSASSSYAGAWESCKSFFGVSPEASYVGLSLPATQRLSQSPMPKVVSQEPVIAPAVRPTGPKMAKEEAASAVASAVKSSPRRDSDMSDTERWQTSMIDGSMLSKSETPPMYFFPEEGVASTMLVKSGGLNGIITHMEIFGLKEGETLRGTLLLPVSGHTGFADAQKWSTTDKFDILQQVGNQFPTTDSPKPQMVIEQRLSTGLVSRVEIEVKVPARGEQVRLLYYRLGKKIGERTGMGAPEGYMEGRLILLSFR